MSHNLTIRGFSSLSVLEKAHSFQIPDLLSRRLEISLPILEDANHKVAVAFDNTEAVGWIRFFPRRLLLYRNFDTGLDYLMPGALVEFPVVERFEPVKWEALIEFALGELFELGASWAGIYLPPDSKRHIDFLQTLGFRFLFQCDDVSFLRSQGYGRSCSLFMRKCAVARGYRRPDLYPDLDRAGLLYTADVTTAPDPSSEFWTQALVYSGYSGYPWLHSVLDTLIEEGTRSILSVPCATADLFRFLPAAKFDTLNLAMGVDIVERSIAFGEMRLKQPHIDIINMLLCHAFFAHKNERLSMTITELLRSVCEVAGRPLDELEADEYYLQLQAAFAEIVLGGAITDWFILMKGIGRLLSLSPEPNIFVEPAEDENSFQYVADLADDIGEDGVQDLIRRLGKNGLFDVETKSGSAARRSFDSGKIRLQAQDMFNMELKESFDTIFVWEAALMVAGAGKESILLDRLKAHLNARGRIIFTGIRSQEGIWPRELDILRRLLLDHRFDVSLVGIKPRPASWAFGYVADIWLPVLIAENR